MAISTADIQIIPAPTVLHILTSSRSRTLSQMNTNTTSKYASLKQYQLFQVEILSSVRAMIMNLTNIHRKSKICKEYYLSKEAKETA